MSTDAEALAQIVPMASIVGDVWPSRKGGTLPVSMVSETVTTNGSGIERDELILKLERSSHEH